MEFGILKKNKKGALIVLKNHNALGEIIESGITLDCDIHRELFLAIFQSTGPIHDGAVVLDHRKIVAAGCFLPLSKNTDISSEPWAQGIELRLASPKNRDTIAVVVSEENSKITYVYRASLLKWRTSLVLRRYLTFLWGTGNQINDILPRTYGDVENE